jgi:hypothetical protein
MGPAFAGLNTNPILSQPTIPALRALTKAMRVESLSRCSRDTGRPLIDFQADTIRATGIVTNRSSSG